MKLTINRLQLTTDKVKKLSNVKPGQIIILSMVFLTFITVVSTALLSRAAGYLRFGANNLRGNQARNLAEAAIEKALWQLNETAGSYTGETNTQLGTIGTFDIQITDKTQILKTITATGYVPNSAEPRSKRTIKVDAYVSTETISFRYAVQVGTGGVDMANSSTINGNVYTNGSITGANSTLIKGDAYAVGTISDPPCTLPDCTEHESQPASEMPEITAIVSTAKTTAEAGGIVDCAITPALCTIGTNGNIGPKKYINGNLVINNNATVTMKGPVWVYNANFSMAQGSTTLKLDDSFGSNNVGMIVDGTIDLTQGGIFQPTNASPKGYIMLVSNFNGNPAIKISQSGSTAIFYSLYGGAQLSQSANVTSLVAQTLTMTQSSQLTYDSGLSSTQFTSGPGGSWQPKKGTYRSD